MERGSTHAILRTVLPDGTIFLFVVEGDDTWTIRRDDQTIATGPSDSRGVERGTRLFVNLTRSEQRPPAISDARSAPPAAHPPD